ncbi:MAG: cellulase family glycosylhydrolase [Fibrella sp.]|nr:cellulase family glycosylhydrolase [Armatimonadota bacterium]
MTKWQDFGAAFGRVAVLLMAVCFSVLLFPVIAGAQTFSVSGNKILRNGQEFVVKGVNVNGPGWGWMKATIPDVSLIVDAWKFNTVRVQIVLGPNRTVGDNENLDALVRAFTTERISAGKTPAVVMLELHDSTGTYFTASSNPSLSQVRDWWVARANEYAGNPNVWFNVGNEPGGSTAAQPEWLTMHDTVIAAVRAAGANNIMVCDGTNWATEGAGAGGATINTADSAILTYGPTLTSRYSNLVFAYHVYHQFNANTVAKMRDYVNRVHNANLCVLVGEWGQTAFDPLESVTATTGMFNVIRGGNARGVQVGRIAWHWYAGDNNRLTNYYGPTYTPGNGEYIDRTDGSRPTNLSWMGELAWDDNYNAALIIDNQPTPLPKTGWTATASVTTQGNPNGVLDGKFGGIYGGDWNAFSWTPGGISDGQWIQIDMQSAKTLNEVRLKPQYATFMPKGWKVYVSNDPNNPGTAVKTFTTANSEVRLRLNSAVTGRYLRVETTGGNNWGGWWTLNELDVYNTAAPPVTTTTTLNPTADRDDYPSNSGTGTTMVYSKWQAAYLKFGLGAITRPIVAAKLRVYTQATGSLISTAYQVTGDSWTETSTTFPGVGAAFSSLTTVAPGYIEYDVTAFVQAQKAGDGVASFGVKNNSDGWQGLFTRESGSNKPQLVLTLQ